MYGLKRKRGHTQVNLKQEKFGEQVICSVLLPYLPQN